MISQKKNSQTLSITDMTLMSLFTALTTVGTSIRVPLPALVGNPFFHFGLPVLCLAVLHLGFFKGSLAGGMGFAIFDVLNGFAPEAPYFILESFIVGAALTFSYRIIKKQHQSLIFIPVMMIFPVIVKITMTFLKNLVIQLMMGNTFGVSAVASFSTLYITFINGIAAIVIVSFLYPTTQKLIKIKTK